MSTTPRDLIIYGAGGFGREIASMCDPGNTGTSGCHGGPYQPPWRVAAFIDDTSGTRGQSIYGVPCLGSYDEAVPSFSGKEVWCHIAIGDNEGRKKIAERIKKVSWKPATVIHNTAYVSRETEVGEGSFFGPYVTVSPKSVIGKYVLLNTRSSIGHHATLGDFSQISLNASVLGYGHVGKGAMIGAHAVVMSNVTVGAWATVAIGTPILRDVKPGHTICLPLAHTIFERKMVPED
jgi:acetyltransferase EpsM